MPFLLYSQEDTTGNDMLFPFQDTYDPLQDDDRKLYGEPPSGVETEFEYDPETGNYEYEQKYGELNYRPPSYLSFDQYQEYQAKKSMNDNWKDIEQEAIEAGDSEDGSAGGGSFRPSINVEGEGFDRIFGGNTIEIRPNGSAELIFGLNSSKTDNPAIPVNQRRITVFDFRQNIQLNVIGNIGDKLKIQTNYNTQATFDFENQMKLEYNGYEDEIIQKLELGNVSLPLQSNLISGSQSLFGVKSELKFGRLTVTSVYTQQKSERREISTEGGAQEVEFEVKADEYEGNKHYFLSHFFRDIYERALATPPIINSSVNITRVEVWVTNTNFSTDQNRNIIAFQDLGESRRVYNPSFSGGNPGQTNSRPASNGANDVYRQVYQDPQVRGFVQSSQRLENSFGLQSRFDYNKVELARKLEAGRDYNLNAQLGYISMVQELQPNQVLAVAFEYTYNGKTYKVGEFSNESNGDEGLILKMLKSNELNTRFPMWDLMMKNVYSIGAYQLSNTGFELGIWYLDRNKGIDINYLPIDQPGFNDRPLLQVVALDRINNNNAQVPDGMFDFLANPQITVNPANGRIFFPVLEPFGSNLREEIIEVTGDPALAERYAFDSLYTNTQANAQYNFPQVNRFSIQGRYQSANSSEIRLNAFNVPEGSVRVTAGGQQLVENTDYTVDYTLGTVKIINQGILESGIPINVSLESNSAFGINRKALFASRFDYKVSDDLNFGGTFMNLSERPLTQKVNFGDEPISNTVVGIDGNYSGESQFLTSMVDKIPLIDTKEKSTYTIMGEAAKLFPGHSRAIGNEGNSFIDDFEGSQSTIDLRTFTLWSMASTPQGQPDLFPEAAEAQYRNDLTFNKNRARMSWYTIDDLFYRDDNTTPDHIRGNPDIQQNHLQRQVFEQEVFPNREFNTAQGLQNFRTNMFDLAFYPDEPGPYNYDVDPVPGATAGLTDQGTLARPETRWAGIQRRIDQTDFDAANIEFIQFWMMDPYAEAETEGNPGAPGYETDGALYFNIGNISEDILKDEYKSFENGFPTTEAGASDLSNPENFSQWGRIPRGQQIVNAFDNNPATRPFQDVGFDGLRDQEEQIFFDSAYVQPLTSRLSGNPEILNRLLEDPSHDNYNFYRDDDYDQQELNILERYKLFNGPDGNSPTSEQSSQENAQGYPTSASTLPDAEDINRDNTLDNVESYFQYKVDISQQGLSQEGRNYINAILETSPQGQPERTVRWIQFRIPVREFDKRVGNIQDLRSIRFMRMFMKGFENPVVLRFARLELVRGEWRRFIGDLDQEGEVIADDPNVSFNIGAVNIEENASKQPVNYVLPPQLQREIQAGAPNLARQNEQSLQLQACGLEDGKAQAAFRNVQLDMRSFKKLQMFLHAESSDPTQPLDDEDIRVFIRVGTDFTDNYYEYETPVTITRPGVYQNDVISDQQAVWPIENNVVIDFEELFRAKRERNERLGLEGDVQLNQRYEVNSEAGRKIYVVGNPNLADARVVMIGVRNPAKRDNPNDDGLPKCVEVWANELRLTHFDQSGGEAAMARVSANLADFASIAVSGQITTPNWGALESRVSERQRETITNFDASAQVQLDKFLPEKTGVKLPMYVGYSQNTSTPQFAPEEPDTPMEIYLDERDPEERDSLQRISQKVTTRKSLNFTNVRKEKTSDGPARFYDISNLSATYAFTEINYRDFNTEYNFTRNYRGGLAYNFTNSPKVYEPFSKVKFLRKSKYLRLIKDFNFSLVPKQVAIRNEFDRRYSERKIRNLNPEATLDQPPFVDKAFNWNRSYNLSYDLSKAIKIDFNANNRALVREFEGEQVMRGEGDAPGSGGYTLNPDGTINFNEGSYEAHRDSVLSSLREFGLTTNYNHNASVSYSLPLNKIPFLDWTNVSTRYTGNYEWRRGPLIDPQQRRENIENGIGYRGDTIGHTVSNGQQLQLNATLNLLSLYNKVPFLREANRGSAPRRGRDIGASAKRNKGEELDVEEEEEEEKEKDYKALKGAARFLMAIKNVSGTYSLNRGITLPGFKHESTYLGMDPNAVMAPGPGFVFGQQTNFGDTGTHFADWAGNEQDWLIRNRNLFNPYMQNTTENISFRSSIQPIRDLRIDVTVNQTASESSTSYWNYNDTIPDPRFTDNNTELITGNYSASILSIATAFQRVDSSNRTIYNQFLDNRRTISNRIGENENINALDSAGYTVGYDATHQDVLIPAFLAAYTGQGANDVRLGGLRVLPLPNWRINYTGLNKIKFFQKYFRSVSVNHSYRSNYTVGGYQKQAAFDNTFALDSFRIQPEYIIGQVTISESFSPLINFDMTWKNSLLTRVEIRRDRTMTLSTSNNQITEIGNMEYIIGTGYTLKDVKLPFTLRGNALNSDLTLRADFSIRDSRTLIRKIVEEETQTTAGQRVYSLKITGDYVLTQALTLRLFYDWVANRPAISNSFPTSNINAGFSLRFTLSG
jgi:cell surface protein SprA